MKVAVASLLAVTLSACSIVAQSPKTGAAARLVAGPVTLTAQPDLIRGEVPAFPRVVPGRAVSAAAAAKINAALARADKRVKAVALDCQASSKASQGKADPEAWQRVIEVTMRGPRFLSFLATDNSDCGGPYPNNGMQMPLVYDLTTGSPVNWLRLLPAGVKASIDSAPDGSNVGLVDWPALTALSKKKAEGECKGAFDDGGLEYSLTLNARTGTLDAQPENFPHVM
ncbi:MAG: hypothetical protein ABI142_06710, partial [Bryocella sp.]